MKRNSESRFLPSFLATGASFVLVCGGLLLLTSTAPWTAREDAGGEAPARLAAEKAYEAAAPREIALAPTASAGREAATDETKATDPGDTSQVAQAQSGEPQQVAPEPVQPVVSEPSTAQSEDTVAASDVTEIDAARTEAADVAQIDEAVTSASEAIAAESMSVSAAEPISETTVETSSVPEAAAVKTGAVEAHVAAEPSSAPSDQIGEMLAEFPPQAIETDAVAERAEDAAEPAPDTVIAETISEDTGGAAAKSAAEGQSVGKPSESSTVTAASPVPLPPPPPPMPQRKPESVPASVQAAEAKPRPERPARAETPKQVQAKPAVTQQAPKQVQAKPAATQQAPKQAQAQKGQAASAVAEQATGQPASGARGGTWLPMALAPADKPIVKQPAARLNGQAYSSKVWAALARSKPRAGQNGSATVTFTIGFGGALSSVRIGKSSGNAKIDQLALATVRGAAFPPPSSGPASFTIRIDFH